MSIGARIHVRRSRLYLAEICTVDSEIYGKTCKTVENKQIRHFKKEHHFLFIQKPYKTNENERFQKERHVLVDPESWEYGDAQNTIFSNNSMLFLRRVLTQQSALYIFAAKQKPGIALVALGLP